MEEGSVLLPDRSGSLKRLHRPNLLGGGWIRFGEKLGFQDHGGSTLIALNAGLVKPRKGFTPVAGKKNWGRQVVFLIDFFNGCVNINLNIEGVLIDSILSGH